MWHRVDELAPSPENAVVPPSRPDSAEDVLRRLVQRQRSRIEQQQLPLNPNADDEMIRQARMIRGFTSDQNLRGL